jgi:hypothetical protein
MKPRDKFPYPIDPTEPLLFDRILSVAAKMRAERKVTLSEDAEARRLAQEQALNAVRRREAIEAAREAQAQRRAVLNRLHIDRVRLITPEGEDVIS